MTSNQWNKKCFTQIIRIFRFSKFLLIMYLYYHFWLHNKLFDFTFIRSIYLIKELNIHTFCGRWERSFMYIFRCCVSSIQYELWAILPEKLISVKEFQKVFEWKDVPMQATSFLNFQFGLERIWKSIQNLCFGVFQRFVLKVEGYVKWKCFHVDIN